MAPHSSTLAWKIPWMEEPGAHPDASARGSPQESVHLVSSLTLAHSWAHLDTLLSALAVMPQGHLQGFLAPEKTVHPPPPRTPLESYTYLSDLTV